MNMKHGLSLWKENINYRVFENKMLGKVFVPKKDEVSGRFRIACYGYDTEN
jgi:hypothetical protein